MKMPDKSLIEVIQNPATAIINALETYDVPWKNNDYYVPSDLDYIMNHSATKYISRMTDMLLNTNGILTNESLGILANVIFKIYKRKWDRLYASYNFEYNPINNYDMIEIMSDDTTEHEYGHTSTRTDDLTHTKTGDETITHDTENQRTDDLNITQTTDIQGFNSNDYVPRSKDTADNTGTQTVTQTGTDSTDYDISETNSGTQGIVEGGVNTDTRNYTLTRSGNIGVTTSQQMIESERKLWEFNFVNIVYNDIDSIMVTNYYKGE